MRGLVALGAFSIWIASIGPAFAQPPTPPPDAQKGELSVSSREIRLGSEADISGGGCAESANVKFDLYDPDLVSSGTFVADENGDFLVRFRAPSLGRVGRAWMRATCATPEGATRVMDATLVFVRPLLVVTWVNVFFGIGITLIVAGTGISVRGRAYRRRRRRRGPSLTIRRRHRRRRRRAGIQV